MVKMVQMEIRKGYPPMFSEIVAMFPLALKEGVLFCWGSTIYNPSGVEVPTYLAAHENVHRKQQGKDPAGWWEKYLADPQFRLEQEIPAHLEEYRQFSIDFPQRNMRRLALKSIAKRLSGPLYCNMLSYEKARALIKERDDG